MCCNDPGKRKNLELSENLRPTGLVYINEQVGAALCSVHRTWADVSTWKGEGRKDRLSTWLASAERQLLICYTWSASDESVQSYTKFLIRTPVQSRSEWLPTRRIKTLPWRCGKNGFAFLACLRDQDKLFQAVPEAFCWHKQAEKDIGLKKEI